MSHDTASAIDLEDDSKSIGAPAENIEITPEMVLAGEYALADSGYGSEWFDDPPEIVIQAVYRAMRVLEPSR